MPRPELLVLAGVNGAGKSSVGGHQLRARGRTWFNPDTFARALVREHGYSQAEANGAAWKANLDNLREAIRDGTPYEFETTLGGNTIPATLLAATPTHAVRIWYCGLDSPERHLRRVAERVAAGGHDIPEAKIRERWVRSMENLIGLLPHLAELAVYDNSVDAAPGEPVPEPRRLLHVRDGRVLYPATPEELAATPEWAMAVVEAALAGQAGGDDALAADLQRAPALAPPPHPRVAQ